MPTLESLTNPYDRQAKLYPMLLTLLPLFLGVAAWMPPDFQVKGVLGSAALTIAVASFLTQLARDAGKRREPELFALWGGRPSERTLSYRAGQLSPATLSRRHKAIAGLDPALRFPSSAAEELADPERFQDVYAAATELLIARSRDRLKFPLLFRENVNYGYRRNLWGMKSGGIAIAVVGLCAAMISLVWDLVVNRNPTPIAMAAAAVCVILLVLWCVRIRPAWVRLPADAYARQLAEVCDRLED